MLPGWQRRLCFRIAFATQLLSIAACGLASPPPSVSIAPIGDPSAAIVQMLSAEAANSSSFEVYSETLNAPPERVFAAVTNVLALQGDPLEQADSDKGFIITGEGKHGVVGFPSWIRSFIVLAPNAGQTRMTFKLCSYFWDDENYPTNMFVHAPDNYEANSRKAARFAEAVRKMIMPE